MVECFGGVPEVLAHLVGALPPVLILHGEEDRVVPVSEARRLERLMREQGLTSESHIYPGQGHTLTGEALADASRRARTFLRKHLLAIG